MGYTGFLKNVTLYDGTTTYTIPIWNLKIKQAPWHSSGQMMVQYFHGKHSTRIQGFETTAEFEMVFSGADGENDQLWSALLNDIAEDVEWVIDFDPDDDPGVRVGTFVLADSAKTHQALIAGKIRGRSTATKWISTAKAESTRWWYTCASDPDPFFDAIDLLNYTQSSITRSGANLTSWENKGTLGADGDLQNTGPYITTDGLPSDINLDAASGDYVVSITTDEESVASTNSTGDGITGLNTAIGGTDSLFEIMCIAKVAAGNASGPIFSWGDSSAGSAGLYISHGNGPAWQMFGGSDFTSPLQAWDDGAWHVYRWRADLSADYILSEIDGVLVRTNNTRTGGSPYFDRALGMFHNRASTTYVGANIALLKVTDGHYSAVRNRELLKLAATKFNIAIPADGEATGLMTAVGNYSTALRWFPFGLGAYSNGKLSQTLWKSTNMWHSWIDRPTQQVYGTTNTASQQLIKWDVDGLNRVVLSNSGGGQTPTYNGASATAIDLVNEIAVVATDTNGAAFESHSTDVANKLDPWTTVLASGTYETYGTLLYHATDQLLYFIDSLAATPSLRTMTTAGASDTKVADLTAGKQYEYMRLDAANNDLYFSNITDGTIDKYDLDTDTLSPAWHTAAGGTPYGVDVYGDKVWYIQDTDWKVYEVDMATPGTKTEMQDVGASLSPTFVTGITVNVFDSTLTT